MCLGYMQILCQFIWGTWASLDLVSTGAPRTNPSRIPRDDCIWKLFSPSLPPPHPHFLNSFPLSPPSSQYLCPFPLARLLWLSSTQVCVPARQWRLLCQLRDHVSFDWHRHGAVAPGVTLSVHHPPLLLQVGARESPHQNGEGQALPLVQPSQFPLGGCQEGGL